MPRFLNKYFKLITVLNRLIEDIDRINCYTIAKTI